MLNFSILCIMHCQKSVQRHVGMLAPYKEVRTWGLLSHHMFAVVESNFAHLHLLTQRKYV